MIVNITKGNFAKGLINYHEKKVESGRGVLILDSTFSRNKTERIAEFLDLADLNKDVKKDRYTHISVSFADEDHVDKEKQLKIAERYLVGMGYGDAPRLIYQHSDTTHSHFHIVTSTIDLNGKKIQIFRDHFRSQELSRQIEKEFNLKVTEYFRHEQQKLQEINASKFSLLKGIEKIGASPGKRHYLEKVVEPALLDKILNEKLSNDAIKKILELREGDKNTFAQLSRIVRQQNAEYKTDKQQLRERLLYVKELSKTRDEFVQRCEQQGIYVRKISKEMGSASFTYGFRDKSFYMHEKNLPLSLRHDYLFTDKKISVGFDESVQKKFLKRIVWRSLSASASLSDFENRLGRAGVKVEYSSNARGRYGVSFKSQNIRDALLIKGSEIGLSWSKLEAHKFGLSDLPHLRTGKNQDMKIPTKLGAQLDTSNDDEDKRRAKASRDQTID